MNRLQDFVDEKLREVAEKLPDLVHQDAASFACGYNRGYKQCLLDLINATGLNNKNL